MIYTGITNNLERRVLEHKRGSGSRFTQNYKVSKLIYYETCSDIMSAIAREKRIKAGSRERKMKQITSMNPEWKDLSPTQIASPVSTVKAGSQ